MHTVHHPEISFSGSPVDLSSTVYASAVFTVTCEVELVPEVDIPVTVSIQWKGPDGVMASGDYMTITNATTVGSITTGRLQFSPLHTSNGGQYTCTSRVTTGSVNVNNSASSAVNVASTFSPVSCSFIRVLLLSMCNIMCVCVLYIYFSVSFSPCANSVHLTQHQ